jgi:hypothetical protein
MNKGIILIGKPNTGKSRLARLLMAGKNSVTINGRDNDFYKNPFIWSACEKNTEVIHIDDLNELRKLEILMNAITEPICVNKRGLAPFYIHPRIIISITGDMISFPYGVSIDRRFDIFELSACNQNYFPLQK